MIAELIRRGGYRGEWQVVQFLAAPWTEEQYAIFARQAQEVADRLGRDVYIVGAPDTTVDYRGDSETFVAVKDDEAVAWRLLTPVPAEHASVADSVRRPEPARRGEELPGYFETNEDGALVARPREQLFHQVFASLVTFEPDDTLDGQLVDGEMVAGIRDDYEEYEAQGGSDPAVVVVGTLSGLPVDPDRGALLAERAAQIVAGLGPAAPVRLVARPLDDAEPGSLLQAWATAFASRLGAAVYVAWRAGVQQGFPGFHGGGVVGG